jgi:hypothetical protein
MPLNMFFVHTPLNIFTVEQMLQNLDEFNHADNMLLLESLNDIDYNPHLWTAVYHLDYVGGCVMGQSNRVKAENNLDSINKIIRDKNNIRIFLSDIQWVMNNRIFFDKRIRAKTTYNLYVDGIPSYIGFEISFEQAVRNLVKYCLGHLGFGVKYHPYSGRAFGEDRSEIIGVYGFNSDLIPCEPGKKRHIPTPGFSRRTLSGNSCLFLDQPYQRYFETAQWEAIQQKTLSYLLSLNGGSLHYKNHHFGRKQDEEYYSRHGFMIVHDQRCIEQFFGDLGCNIAISYSSSALLNLKLLYGDNVRCISLIKLIDKIPRSTERQLNRQIIDLYEKVGVDVVRDI